MPIQSKYPDIEIPNVGIYDFLFGERKRDYPDDKGSCNEIATAMPLNLQKGLDNDQLTSAQRFTWIRILHELTPMLKSNQPRLSSAKA